MAKKKPKKSDAAGVARRVEEILQIVLDGAGYAGIVQFVASQGWEVKERMIRQYIGRAYKLLVERQERKRSQIIARHLAQRQKLFARAVNAGDYRTALAILADEAKLRGLYPEKDVKELVKLAASQNDRIRELEARGFTAGLVILDEAARIPDGMIAAVRPMLAVSGGRLVCLSTAFAKSGFFYEQWTGPEPWERVKVTAEMNPRITPAFLAEERRALGPRWYAMEYDGEFGDDVAAVFATDDIRAAMADPTVRPLSPAPPRVTP
ncbi:MAG: terminase family protein [Gemmataceae bacterium]|nr:terminase family protein [Gemmataceae bacterium]